MTRGAVLLCLALAALAVSGCGRKGEPVSPGPPPELEAPEVR